MALIAEGTSFFQIAMMVLILPCKSRFVETEKGEGDQAKSVKIDFSECHRRGFCLFEGIESWQLRKIRAHPLGGGLLASKKTPCPSGITK
jgi:hypothetical protein